MFEMHAAPKQYQVSRSDGVTEVVMMPKGTKLEQYYPGVPSGVLMRVKRVGGSLERFYVSAAGTYVRLFGVQAYQAWEAAVASHALKDTQKAC